MPFHRAQKSLDFQGPTPSPLALLMDLHGARRINHRCINSYIVIDLFDIYCLLFMLFQLSAWFLSCLGSCLLSNRKFHCCIKEGRGHEGNFRDGEKPFTSSLNICPAGCCRRRCGGGGRSNVFPPHCHPFSQTIRGNFVEWRRNLYSPPRCFLSGRGLCESRSLQIVTKIIRSPLWGISWRHCMGEGAMGTRNRVETK